MTLRLQSLALGVQLLTADAPVEIPPYPAHSPNCQHDAYAPQTRFFGMFVCECVSVSVSVCVAHIGFQKMMLMRHKKVFLGMCVCECVCVCVCVWHT